MKPSFFSLAGISLIIACGCPAQKTETSQTTEPVPLTKTPEEFAADTDFTRLKLADFETFQAEKETWTEEGGMIITTGVPKGYIYSRKPYRNFTLRAEYQFTLTQDQMGNVDKANTGFMIAIQEPHKIWPASLEVQGRFEMMGSINGNGGISNLMISDLPEVRERMRRPLDQWNAIEIIVRDGAVTAKLNGEVVCKCEPTELKSGLIGLQAEGYVVRFRDLRIRDDDAASPGK